jgi:hypothetical protein
MDRKNVLEHIVNTMENIRKKLREGLTNEDLAVWFGTKKKPKGSKQPKGPWVNICRKEDGKHPPCGREKATGKSYPKCRAAGVAARMSDEQKRAACAQKRRVEKKSPKIGKGNKPTMASYKPRKESIKRTITLKESELISLIERMVNESISQSISDDRKKDSSFFRDLIKNSGITSVSQLLAIKKEEWVDSGKSSASFPMKYYKDMIGDILLKYRIKNKDNPNNLENTKGSRDTELDYPFIIKILKKMYDYEVTVPALKSFEEESGSYDGTKNSYDYIEQYNDYMNDIKGVKHHFDRLKRKY